MEKGRTWLALSPPSLKTTTRCRLPGFSGVAMEVHSKPMNAVNRPGSSYFSAASISRCQIVRAISGLSIGSLFFETASPIQSWKASLRFPAFTRSWTLRPNSLFSSSGFDSSIIGARPRFSAWSDTTRKSSGRTSRTGCPVLDTTSSPRAKRNASSGSRVFPIIPASVEYEVCRCVSPQKTSVAWSDWA